MSVIVVGYSSKPEGNAALDRALEEAMLRGSSVVVVHTVRDADLAALEQRVTAAEVVVELHAADDPLDPAEDVLGYAERCSADFIVIGLRKRSPVGKLLLGSNAQRVLLDAACPVMAVKANHR